MTFAVDSTVEQRYPGATPELARASARDRVEAFTAAGWAVREERWLPDSVTAAEPGSGAERPFSVTRAGSLAVVFVATREASLPVSLKPGPVQAESGPSLSGYLIRLVVGLVVFAVVLAILLSVALPLVVSILGTGASQPAGG